MQAPVPQRNRRADRYKQETGVAPSPELLRRAEPAPAEGAVEEGNAPVEAPQQEAPKAKPTLSLRHKENDDLAYSGSQTTDAGNQPAKAKPRVGRNDPCPCGSGKKYKKCCGMGKV